MADPSLGEPSRASNALFKRQEQLQRWKQSETAREPVVKPTKRPKLKFDDGTVFLSAVSASDIDEVKKLLQKGADVNYQNVDGVTALHQACIDENYDLVELLVQRKANLEIRDNEGWSALHAAASSGNLDITEFLVEHGADIAVVNNEGELPLDLAEEDEMEEYMQDQLQKSRVDVEAARAEEERVMEEDAQSWLNKGQITETKDSKTGATALHVAVSKGYTKVINLLLQTGSDPNAPDVDEWTPLHAASHWGQEEACKLLADYGADFTLRNHVGLTALDLAEPDMENYLEELKKKQMEKPKLDPITPSIKTIGSTVHPPLTRRRSITRIKDTGLISKTDVSQERKALAAVQKETLVEVKQETEEKSSSSSTETDSEEESDEESSGEESEEKENQRRSVSEKFANKRGSESDSESEKNNTVTNSVKNQPLVNSVRGRNTAFSRFDNKNSVPTATATNSTARILNSTSRIYSNRQQSVEKKEEPRPSDRFQSKGPGSKVDVTRSRVNSNRAEEAAETERTNSRELDSRRKVFERNRPTSGYLAKANSEDSKDAKQDDGKDRVEIKTNEDNTKNAKEEDARPSYRSQLRDSKPSTYQSRVRPSSRNFDEDKSKPNEDKSKPNEDKSKPNDVDSYLARRGNLPGRVSLFSDKDKDKDKSKENDATTISSYASRRSRLRDEGDSTSSMTTPSASRPTSNYLRSTSSDIHSSRVSEREKEKERQKEKEKESEKEKQSEKEKEKEKEMEKESADKSAASSARARKMRRPREKRRSTGVAYMPSGSDEEVDELQEAKKNTMMNEDIEEKEKSKDETKSVSDRIRQGRTGTSVTDRFKNSTKAADVKMPTDVNTLQEKLRETQNELDESKVKLEKTLEEKNKLERKLGDMEDDLKQLKDLKQDNQRLKDENGALIRVISKLSRTPT